MNIWVKKKAERQRRGHWYWHPYISLLSFHCVCSSSSVFFLTPRNPVKFVLLALLHMCKGKLIGVTLLVSGKAFHLSFTVLPDATTSRKSCYPRPHPWAFHGTGQLFTKMAVWMAPVVGVLRYYSLHSRSRCVTSCYYSLHTAYVRSPGTRGLFDSFCFLCHAPYASTYILQGYKSLQCMESVSAFLWSSLDRHRDCCVLTCPVCCLLSLGLCGMGGWCSPSPGAFLSPKSSTGTS